MNAQTDRYDVVVVGGGAAGLSAGITLARAKRRVIVIDAGQPRNAPAAGVHGLLGREGIAPDDLLRRGRRELAEVGGDTRRGSVAGVRRVNGDLEATTADGAVRARRLLIATGLVDVLPEIPGVAERWGREIIHCPYCHGWEVRDEPLGVIATSERSVHQGLLFRQWTDDLVYFTRDIPLPHDDRERLDAIGVVLIDGEIDAVTSGPDGDGRSRVTVRMRDGREYTRHALAVGSRLEARAEPFRDAGVGVTPHPGGYSITADSTGRTEVPGIWVAGNAVDPMAQVGAAAADGVRVAAQINADLVMTDADTAVARRRHADVS